MALDGSVGVGDACRRDDDRRAGWKGYDKAAFPEDDVAASRRIEITEGSYGTATKSEVVGVHVAEAGHFGAEVDGGGGPGTFRKIGAEVGVAFQKRIAAAGVVLELLGHPRRKNA